MTNEERTKLQELADREEIRDVLWRYCRGVDRADPEVLRSIYWPESTENHDMFIGLASDFVGHVLGIVQVSEMIQHIISNPMIRIAGAGAKCESSFFVYTVWKAPDGWQPGAADEDDGRRALMLGGRYLDEFERRGNDWRVLHRVVAYDWWRMFDAAPKPDASFNGHPMVRGAYRPDDPSYEMLFKAPILPLSLPEQA